MRNRILILSLILVTFFVSCQSQAPTVCYDANGKPIDVSNGETSLNAQSNESPAQTINQKYLPMVVKLGRDNCAPCIEMNKILEEVKSIVGEKAVISIIDVSREPDKAQLFGIKMIPTEIFYDSNFKEIYRIEGVIQKEEVLSWLKKAGAQF